MSLVNELKERRTHVLEELNRVEDLRAELADFDRAIAALEPALTDEQPELFEDQQEVASEQLASDHALPPSADDVAVEEAPALNEAMQDEPEQPVEDGYAPVTNPEADQVVSAMSWYSPKEIAERNKFDPFGLFKREKEDA
jgi:hypothetical protein